MSLRLTCSMRLAVALSFATGLGERSGHLPLFALLTGYHCSLIESDPSDENIQRR